VVKEKGRFVILESVYLVEVELAGEEEGLRYGDTGQAWFVGPPKSMVLESVRSLWRTLVKESSF